jgi:hypothetical protein
MAPSSPFRRCATAVSEGMSFDVPSFLVSLLISSIGFVLLSYGRKMSRPPQLIAGVLLLGYPYFVPSVTLMLGIAAVILTALWLAVQQGY